MSVPTFETGKPDEIGRNVDDSDLLAHVEHEHLAAASQGSPPEEPAAPLRGSS
jgi:hypothetical protein